MKITLLAYGSRGDVQPFVALAEGLQSVGHSVRLAAPQRFIDLAAEYSISFVPLAGNPEEMSAQLNDARSNVLGMVKKMSDYVLSIAEPVARVAFAACEDADLVVHSFLFTTGAHSLAQARGIPDVSVQGFPIFTPTRAFPMVAMANLPPGALSYFSHWLGTQLFWRVGNTGYRRLRSASPDVFNLELVWPWKHAQPVQTPLIFAYSPTVLPRPDDWHAPYIHIPGYFFLEASESYQPPPELTDFLATGEPPICVTFGSMVNREAQRIQQIVYQSLNETGQRAVLLSGWSGAQAMQPGNNLLALESAPHDWLFSRCKAVIHHGGAGTTGAGLRAGIANIVIPHGLDQLFWGKRVAQIGAGPAPIGLSKLSVHALSAAIDQANDPALRARASMVGGQIRSEDGVGEAVRIIEQHAAFFKAKK